MESPQGRKGCSGFYLNCESTEKRPVKAKNFIYSSPFVCSQYSTPEDLKRSLGTPPGFEVFRATPKKLDFLYSESPQSNHSKTKRKTQVSPLKQKNCSFANENFQDLYISELQKFSAKLISEHTSQLENERVSYDLEIKKLKTQMSELKNKHVVKIRDKNQIIRNLLNQIKELDPEFKFNEFMLVCDRCKVLEKENLVKDSQFKELQNYVRNSDLLYSIHQLKIIKDNYLSGYSKTLRSNIYQSLISLEIAIRSLPVSEALLPYLESLATSIKSLFTLTKSLEHSCPPKIFP